MAEQLQALADPTRRAIFERLARKPAAVGELADDFPISRPAVSRHLRVLKDAKLVVHDRAGTQNIYRVDREGLAKLRDLWHFHFYGETPLKLVKGRERIYFEHFWNDFATDRTKSIPEADRQLYAAAYARDDGMRAGFEVFRNFEQDAKDFAGFAQTRLDVPFLVLTGEKACGTFLIEQTKLVANNVTGVVIKGSGHWLMDEARDQVMPQIVQFLNAPPL